MISKEKLETYIKSKEYKTDKLIDSLLNEGYELVDIIKGAYSCQNFEMLQYIKNNIHTFKDKINNYLKEHFFNIDVYLLVCLAYVFEKQNLILLFKELKRNINNDISFQDKLDNLLYRVCDSDNDNLISFLLDVGANKEIIKEYMKECFKYKKVFNSFKKIIKIDDDYSILYRIISDYEWNKDKIVEKQLDNWLEESFKQENIEFILEITKTFREEILKCSIEQNHFNSFKKIIEGTEDNILYKIISDYEWNKDKIVEKQLDNWLEEKINIINSIKTNKYSYFEQDDNNEEMNIEFILEITKTFREEILKSSIEQNHFNIFKILIEKGADFNLIINDLNICSKQRMNVFLESIKFIEQNKK